MGVCFFNIVLSVFSVANFDFFLLFGLSLVRVVFVEPALVLLQRQGFLGHLVSTENLPFFVSDELAESVRIVNHLIEVPDASLRNIARHRQKLTVHSLTQQSFPTVESFPDFAQINLQIILSFGSFEVHNEIVHFLLKSQVEAPRVKSVNVNVIEPNQVLETVSEAHLPSD